MAVLTTLRLFFLGAVFAWVTIEMGYLRDAAILHSLSNVYGYFLVGLLADADRVFLLLYMVVMPGLALWILARTKRSRA